MEQARNGCWEPFVTTIFGSHSLSIITGAITELNETQANSRECKIFRKTSNWKKKASTLWRSNEITIKNEGELLCFWQRIDVSEHNQKWGDINWEKRSRVWNPEQKSDGVREWWRNAEGQCLFGTWRELEFQLSVLLNFLIKHLLPKIGGPSSGPFCTNSTEHRIPLQIYHLWNFMEDRKFYEEKLTSTKSWMLAEYFCWKKKYYLINSNLCSLAAFFSLHLMTLGCKNLCVFLWISIVSLRTENIPNYSNEPLRPCVFIQCLIFHSAWCLGLLTQTNPDVYPNI